RPRGSVVFRLNGDGAVLFDSGTLTGRSEAQTVSVDVRDVDKLSLIVDYADAMDLSDHAVWAGARLIGPASSSGGDR
ncbi:MAG: NPCBM/NEW2 domain-containing protein, partial [Phycisphaerae bacterium]